VTGYNSQCALFTPLPPSPSLTVLGATRPPPADDELARRMFLVILRLGTPGEAGGPSPAAHGSLLYDNWLLDIPKLLDVCSLYAHTNPTPLKTLLSSVFQLQPQYLDDLNGTPPPAPPLAPYTPTSPVRIGRVGFQRVADELTPP
jgi:hypothetical protein